MWSFHECESPFINLIHQPCSLARRTCSNITSLLSYWLLNVSELQQHPGTLTDPEGGLCTHRVRASAWCDCSKWPREILLILLFYVWGIWEWREELFFKGCVRNQREMKPWTLVSGIPQSNRTPSRCYLCFPFHLADGFSRFHTFIVRDLVKLFQEQPVFCPV